MPKPKKGQSKSEFMGICIPTELRDGTASTPAQAAAICYSVWREHEKETEACKKKKIKK